MVVSILLNASTPANAQAPTITKETAQAVVSSTLPGIGVFDKLPGIPVENDKLDEWIEKLIQEESGGREDIIVLDVNGRYSFSCGQFQMATFQGFYPLLKTPANPSKLPSGASEWRKAIMDCSIQKRLIKAMILTRYDNWKHWRNSVKKIGLPPK